jgi:ribosomal protein L29
MKKEEIKTKLAEIANTKKELLLMRIKKSSGENISHKEYKEKKKEVARLFTKLNANKA